MLELGPRELLTFGVVITGIATTWGVLKATIKSITSTLDDVREDVAALNQRLDKVEARQAVALSSIDVMAKDILSPQILKELSERDGAVESRLRTLETQVEGVQRMHNGTHPPIRGGHV